MSLDPDVMAARLRSYATAIAGDQGVTVERVLEVMRTALADLTHLSTCSVCAMLQGTVWASGTDGDAPASPAPTAVMVPVAPQDVTNA